MKVSRASVVVLGLVLVGASACGSNKTLGAGVGGSGGSTGGSGGSTGGDPSGGSNSVGGSAGEGATGGSGGSGGSMGGTGGGGGADATGGSGGSGGSGATGGTGALGGSGGSPGECGDGNVDADEDCDDGDNQDADGCQADCTPSFVIDGPLLQVDPEGLDLTTGVEEDNNNVIFFPEALDHELTGNILIDVHVPGAHASFDDTSTYGIIPAGAVVNSYYFHYDIVGTTPATTQTVTIEFPNEIMAIVAADVNKPASDTELGVPTVTYANTTLADPDTIELLADRRTLKATLSVDSDTDTFRVITRAPDDSRSLVVSGSVTLGTAPSASLALDVTESDNVLFFPERSRVALPGAIDVDFVAPGTYTGWTNASTPEASLGADTAVSSLFFHLDPLGSNAVTARGAVTFPDDLLALLVRNDALDATDGLGAATTTYPTGAGRGSDAADEYVVYEDNRSFSFVLSAGTGIDQTRALIVPPAP